jgi:hypothetical protein
MLPAGTDALTVAPVDAVPPLIATEHQLRKFMTVRVVPPELAGATGAGVGVGVPYSPGLSPEPQAGMPMPMPTAITTNARFRLFMGLPPSN